MWSQPFGSRTQAYSNIFSEGGKLNTGNCVPFAFSAQVYQENKISFCLAYTALSIPM